MSDLNQRRTLEALDAFARMAAPAINQMQLQIDALAEIVRRRVAPDLLPIEFAAEVAEVKEEILACRRIGDGLHNLGKAIDAWKTEMAKDDAWRACLMN